MYYVDSTLHEKSTKLTKLAANLSEQKYFVNLWKFKP